MALRRSFASIVQTSIRQASTFKAAVLKEVGQPLKIESVKAAKLNKDQVRVKVSKCGVNSADLLVCQGEYHVKPKLPFVPGFEVAGEVLEVGSEVKTLQKGDRVIGLNKDLFSGFAQQCILNQNDVWNLPGEISFKEGAALPDSYATALLGLARRAQLQEGDSVLVTAAAGGLGLAAVDLAANVYRAKVIGVCGTEDKASLVREKGAWAALTYKPEHLRAKVKEITEGKGVRVIFDAVGGHVFEESLKCVAHEGMVVVAGFASKQIPQVETSSLLPKAFSLVGVSLSNYRISDPEVYRQSVEDVVDMCEQGLISPHVSAEFDLEKVNEAFEFLRERRSTGKVILDCDD
ncbi:quinone oxidoreductase-like protein 2 homolog [Neocloeon triangulifer]|uniref:quinone oxidoreductase-like protein 2 homolog n=1 Tax=Neocloeon triangulifer TaxID=2078957 RepID=UPI00286EC2EC|nr:quinone oxidoreductase-like protein 2 homolog [Neocloeon triangulifer]